MPFPLAIPLLSLVGGLASSIIGNMMSRSTSSDTMQQQYKLNQQGIDTANRYNLPINQMSRLRDAGLNPNLVYGNGTVAGLTSSGEASTNQGYKQVPFDLGVGAAVESYQQNRQIDQQIDESKSRQALMGQQMMESAARELKFTKDALATEAELPYIQDYLKQRLKNMKAEESYTITREQLAEIEKTNAVALTNYYAARTNLTEEQASTEIKKRFVMDSQEALNRANIKVSEKELEWLSERILNVRQDTANKELWYRMQEAEFDSRGALKQLLANHENWAIFYSILKDIFGGGIGLGLSASYKF